jgi:hypothetical protein
MQTRPTMRDYFHISFVFETEVSALNFQFFRPDQLIPVQD